MITHAFAQVLAATQAAPWHPPLLGSVVVAYLGPQTVLPLASILAAAIGVILMFWRYIMALCRNLFRKILNRGEAKTATQVDQAEGE